MADSTDLAPVELLQNVKQEADEQVDAEAAAALCGKLARPVLDQSGGRRWQQAGEHPSCCSAVVGSTTIPPTEISMLIAGNSAKVA